MLFKGNLRGQPAKSYEKIKTRLEVSISASWEHMLWQRFNSKMLFINLQNKFSDQYKLFLLTNPEDDKPVAVVVPRRSLEPETTGNLTIRFIILQGSLSSYWTLSWILLNTTAAVPEWFAAGSFGLVALFTLFLRNVPALQADLL